MPKRPSNAPPVDGPVQQRIKLTIFILIFGPMVLFGLYHLTFAVVKMARGEAVGYMQSADGPGVVRPQAEAD